MTLAELKTELNIRLGDTDNFTFTDTEKTSYLTEAVNDENTVKEIWDDSLSFTVTTFEYAIPATLTTVKDIYVKSSSSSLDHPEKIASNLWEVVDGNIHFKNGASHILYPGATLYLKGHYKYTVDDTIAETSLQEFVLNNAQLKALRQLGVKKSLKFLKNDTTMGEIVAVKRELEREVAQYKARLPRSFEVA